jgi:Domain of unknown function (DUF4326)
MIEVANIKNGMRPGDVRCDRETKWGNPFILREEKDRDKVCDLHAYYFDEIIKPNNQELVRTMLKIGGLNEQQIQRWMEKTNGYLDISELFEAKRMLCWCKNPDRRCHCDYIKRMIEARVTPKLEIDKR